MAQTWLYLLGALSLIIGIFMFIFAIAWRFAGTNTTWTGGMIGLLVAGSILIVLGVILLFAGYFTETVPAAVPLLPPRSRAEIIAARAARGGRPLNL